MIPSDIRNAIIVAVVGAALAAGVFAYEMAHPKKPFIEPVAYCQATAGVVSGEYFDTDLFAPCRDVLREQDI